MKRNASKSSFVGIKLVIIVLILAGTALSAAPSAHDAIVTGDACYQRNDFEGALWHYTAAKDLDPNQAGTWEKMAWASHALGKTNDALNFAVEAENRGMDKPRLSKVRAWIYMKKADMDREAGNEDSAKTNYQHAINFASGGVDQPLAQAASARLAELNKQTASDTTASATTAATTTETEATTETTATATTTATSTDDPAAPGELKPPSKEEIESRIKEFASEKNLTTFTDPNGRMQVKDSSGNIVPLGAEIFAPSGKMPSKDVIEARIKKWAAKVGLTTATDEKSGRLIAKDSNGNPVPLPPSIFYPERETASETAIVATTTANIASTTSTVASSTATIVETGVTTISSPEDTLLND